MDWRWIVREREQSIWLLRFWATKLPSLTPQQSPAPLLRQLLRSICLCSVKTSPVFPGNYLGSTFVIKGNFA